MKDGCISKMIITETRHWATQYKKIIYTLSALCADKNYRFINEVLCTWIDIDKTDFTLPYPNTGQWSNIYDIEIKTVNRLVAPIAGTGKCPFIIVVEQRTHVFDTNFQKQLSKIKSQEYSKFVADKKALTGMVLNPLPSGSKKGCLFKDMISPPKIESHNQFLAKFWIKSRSTRLTLCLVHFR